MRKMRVFLLIVSILIGGVTSGIPCLSEINQNIFNFTDNECTPSHGGATPTGGGHGGGSGSPG
jgi:hypothetical protein